MSTSGSVQISDRTSDAEAGFAPLGYDSQLRGVSTFLTSDPECTQNLESAGYLVWRTFRISVCRVTVWFRISLETAQSPKSLTIESPKHTVTHHTDVRKLHRMSFKPQILCRFRILCIFLILTERLFAKHEQPAEIIDQARCSLYSGNSRSVAQNKIL